MLQLGTLTKAEVLMCQSHGTEWLTSEHPEAFDGFLAQIAEFVALMPYIIFQRALVGQESRENNMETPV